MKILRIIPTMNPSYGGPCQGIRNSIPALNKFGITNEVVCFDEEDIDYKIIDEFEIHKLGKGIGPYKYNSKFRNWLNKNFNRFDLVIVHGLWQYTSYGAFLEWKKFQKSNSKFPKFYIMPHGMLDPYFQKSPDRKFKAIRNFIFWNLFEKKVINNSNAVLFTCQRELELANETFNSYNPKNVLNVGYGIKSPPLFKNEMREDFLRRSGLKDSEPFILFLSRIHPKKGVDILIDVYQKIKGDNPNIDIPKLVIAGPLESAYSTEIYESVKGREDIIFTNMLQGNAKWGALYSCEAFILPSHQENFGIAVVEALACSSPVLITNKVNIWKEIESGNAGIVDNDTKKGIYSLLSQWLRLDKNKKEVARTHAKNTYLNKFTNHEAANQFIEKLNLGEIKS